MLWLCVIYGFINYWKLGKAEDFRHYNNFSLWVIEISTPFKPKKTKKEAIAVRINNSTSNQEFIHNECNHAACGSRLLHLAVARATSSASTYEINDIPSTGSKWPNVGRLFVAWICITLKEKSIVNLWNSSAATPSSWRMHKTVYRQAGLKCWREHVAHLLAIKAVLTLVVASDLCEVDAWSTYVKAWFLNIRVAVLITRTDARARASFFLAICSKPRNDQSFFSITGWPAASWHLMNVSRTHDFTAIWQLQISACKLSNV